MEAQVDTMSVGGTQIAEDPPSGKFTWAIENFSRINMKKLYSDIFHIGGYKWRILILPKRNNVDHLSIYLDVADSASLPYGWSRYAQFSLAVLNQMHNKFSIRKETQHQFNEMESDWGFTLFMPLSELYNPTRGYIVNDTCVIEADVAVRRVVDYWAHDSKKETGYVGLKNQGATCYMNSLLQTLYHIPYFRKAVYHMPTTENDMPSGSFPLALQSLFYKLQYSDTSVAVKKLTKSFGWDTHDSFTLHAVQELNRVLCEKLENNMKGTVVEGTIQRLFEGHRMNYIECINVYYKSTRTESFYDLQLDVRGCRDVYASFDKYVEVERLEGDNRYHVEQHGLQVAKKGVLFIDFPPVLQLQLKRFEYDFMQDTVVKINDRYEFPLQLDLDRDNRKYLSPEADLSVRNLYTLHSVLVHCGGVQVGHYYAFIRPTLSDQWFKFDDEKVTKEDMKRALEEQYGGEEELPQTNPGFNNSPFKFTKYSNAYMLVYIRESDKDKIICDVDEKDIAEHLQMRLKKEQLKKEQKEMEKKEKAEAHLYTIIKVARDEDLRDQIGKEIFFDLVDHDKARNFRVQKQMPFQIFKEEMAKEFDIPVQCQRFWLWAKRQNHTYRPHRPVTPQEEAQTVGQLKEVSNKASNAELKLFLEVERGLDLKPVPPPEKTKEDILLFFKLYDPAREELRYIGWLFVKVASKPMEILMKLNEMAGFSPDEAIELFEEIKFDPYVMCEPVDMNFTFHASQLEDGDIICFQKSHKVGSGEDYRYPIVPGFMEYVYNRQAAISPRAILEESSSTQMAESALQVEERVEQTLAEGLTNQEPGASPAPLQVSPAEPDVQRCSSSTSNLRASRPKRYPHELKDLVIQLQQLLLQESFTASTFSELELVLSQIGDRPVLMSLRSACMLLRTQFWHNWKDYEKAHSLLGVVSSENQLSQEQTLLEITTAYDRQREKVDAIQAELATVEAEIALLQAKRTSLLESMTIAEHDAKETYLQMEQEQCKQEERSQPFVSSRANIARIKAMEVVRHVIVEDLTRVLDFL